MLKNIQLRCFILQVMAVVASLQLHAQTEFKTKSISIFKNGQSFVVKEGSVSTTDKVYTMDDLPKASFGTLWFTGLQADVAKVVSRQEASYEAVERKAIGFAELLYANKGKRITLTTADDKSFTGTVEDFDLPEEINSAIQLKEAEFAQKYSSVYNADFHLFPSSSPVLLLKMNNTWMSIDPAHIKTIEFFEKPIQKATSKVKVIKPLIKIYFTQGGQQLLNVMYLRDGISWTPTYLLQLLSDTEARLKLQAEVVNDMEDLKDANINFVVGVPNFKFAGTQATLTSFVNRLYNTTSDAGNRFSNAIIPSSQMMGTAKYSINYEAASEPMENVEATASEDLYFYNIKNVDLEKGGRAHYPLLNTLVKIKHLYECNLMSATNDEIYDVDDEDGTFSFNETYSNVYHSIEITNDTKTPFTTGSVLIVQDETQNPLAEDLIKYTGSGTTSSILLTQSPDVRVEEKAKIISSQEDIRKKDGYSYNLITVQSEVTAVNSKSKGIDLAVTKSLYGKCQNASIKYDSRSAVYGNNINPLQYLTFKTHVKAGEKQKFTYTYTVYVRR